MTRKILIACCFVLQLIASQTFAQGFTEVSLASGIQHMHRAQIKMGGGAAWFDMDRDGDEDLIMTGGLDGEGLYRNEGNGQFVDVTYSAGLGFLDSVQTLGVCTGDIDNDGYREIFFTTFMGEANVLLYNNGNGTFNDISFAAGIAADSIFATSAMFLDFDRDRDLDLYVGNYVHSQHLVTDSSGAVIGFAPVCEPDHLFMNDGNLHFTEIGAAIGLADSGCALAVTQTHYGLYKNAVFVANDFGEFNIPNQFFAQQTFGLVFANRSQTLGLDVGMYGMGIAQADYDHDTDIDYYITNIGPNKLMNGNPTSGGFFQDVAAAAGVQSGTLLGLNTTGWGTAFLDYDNDTWEDLYTCNGQITVAPFIANAPRDPDKLYRNNGNGTFADVTMAMGIADSGWGRGMIRGDYDLDGDDDVLTMVIHYDTASTEHSKLWRNDLNNANHWVNVRLEGTTNSPRDPYGAIVDVHLPQSVAYWRYEISGGGSHMSQNSSIAHIGLGADTTYELMVTWPSGGLQRFLSLPIDTTITLLEDSSQFLLALPEAARPQPVLTLYPNPTSGEWLLQMQSDFDEAVQIEVWDMQGRLVMQLAEAMVYAGRHTLRFDENSLPHAGSYLVRLRTETHQVSKMLIRQ